jgi:23S rRNA U2552 (ribose-2'-O)-methylase RlmE/FtsJ
MASAPALRACDHKLVFLLPGNGTDAECESEERVRLERVNDALHSALNSCKDQIASTTWRWDVCKRLSNEYELVRCVAMHQPVSRAFFKLWEVLHDYRADIGIRALVAPDTPDDAPMTAAFLAEGPGGFVESFATFRGPHARDTMHCITLVSSSQAVPGWKLQAVRRAAPNSSVRVHRGEDGTGNLYRIANIDAFSAPPLFGACQLVTADGGFDFSGDFNAQETASARLLLCEVYAALRLQATGGAFVLKMFDVRSDDTVALLYALRLCYTDVRILKPLTSRPANSEKYALCTGFLGATPPELMAAMRSAICAAECTSAATPTPSLPRAPTWFLAAVVHLNSTLVERQVRHITATLALARQQRRSKHKDALPVGQMKNALAWCKKYGLGVSDENMTRSQPI